jgi:putative ABC transport system substrate-binding protein
MDFLLTRKISATHFLSFIRSALPTNRCRLGKNLLSHLLGRVHRFVLKPCRSYKACKGILNRLVFVLLALTPLPALAHDIVLVYDNNSNYQSHFASKLSEKLLAQKGITLKTVTNASFSIVALKKTPPDLIVSLNSDVSEKLIAANIQTSSYHALTTLARSIRYAPCLPDCLTTLPQHRFFVLDQPAARQLNLIRLIDPNIQNIGVIVTARSSPHLKNLKQLANVKNLTINEYLTDAASVRYQINDISKASDAILAIADKDIYNASSLPQILLTSYRYKTPVIGFSKGFINAGAISGAVSSSDQLVQHLSEYLLNLNNTRNKIFDSLIYPKYFEVISNRNVAKSLNLHFPSDDQLKKQLTSNETEQ